MASHPDPDQVAQYLLGPQEFEDYPIFKPHHIIKLQYPKESSSSQQIRNDILTPRLATQRYEPYKLVPNLQVSQNTYPSQLPETAFFSISSASSTYKDLSRQVGRGRGQYISDAQTFVNDVEFVRQCTGETILEITSLMDDMMHTKDEDLNLRIVRTTAFRFAGQRQPVDSDYYLLHLGELARIDVTGKLWLKNLWDLLLQKTDRAYHHICVRTPGSGSPRSRYPGNPPWKQARDHNTAALIALTVTSSFNEDGTCEICYERLGSVQSVVRLFCEGKHVFCRDCAFYNFNSGFTILAAAWNCPKCRTPCFSSQQGVIFASDGTSYLMDDRYTSFENFLRANADLDLSRADQSDHHVGLPEKLVKGIFEILEEGCLLESALSTAYHLQPVRCAEFPLFKVAVSIVARRWHNCPAPLSTLYRCIMTELLDVFNRFFPSREFAETETSEERASREQDPTATAKNALRPGFYIFAERFTSRLLEFVLLRQCECEEGDLHIHGPGPIGRYYFNPQRFFTDKLDPPWEPELDPEIFQGMR